MQWKYVLYISIFSGGDWFDRGESFAGYYKTKINFLCAPGVSVESSAPTFITQEVDLFVIEFRTSAVCKFVDVECVTRSTLDNEYYDLKPLSLSSGTVCYECDDRNNNS